MMPHLKLIPPVNNKERFTVLLLGLAKKQNKRHHFVFSTIHLSGVKGKFSFDGELLVNLCSAADSVETNCFDYTS